MRWEPLELEERVALAPLSRDFGCLALSFASIALSLACDIRPGL